MMPTMPPDSHKISLKIIEAIKQHPVLYINDVKGSTVKLQEFRQKVWKRISDELSLDPSWMRLKWKNLRDTYCRILKYKNKTDKGVRRKKWIFEDHLSFLKFPYEPDYQPQCIELSDEYIEDINNGGIVDTQVLLEQLEDKEDDDYSEYLEVLEETAADPVLDDTATPAYRKGSKRKKLRRMSDSENKTNQQPELDAYVKQIESKYRKIRPKNMLSEESAPLKITNSFSLLNTPDYQSTSLNGISTIDATSVSPIIITSPSVVPVSKSLPQPPPSSPPSPPPQETTTNDETKNSTELFFHSMARTVKLLPLKAQVEIKMAVCKIVTEAEMKYSNGNEYKSTQRFVTPPGMMPKLILVPCSMIDKPIDRVS
ncbi:uncharacterized protein [Venturia canescens]|uniref:uncharacterized protein n=1 Tax=Venturia canescens TaxID=32260 RepID=UPI001C9CE701|nr:uncharacterized protein LOC122406562 [Venturia canescens]